MADNNIMDAPSDRGKEQLMIGILFKHPEYILQCPWFKSEYFFTRAHSALYKAVFTLIQKGYKTVSEVALKDVIDNTESIKKEFYADMKSAPDFGKIYSFYDNVASKNGEPLVDYKIASQKVMTMAFRRDAYNTSQRFADMCLKLDNTDINDLHLRFQHEFNQLSEQYVVNRDIKPVGSYMDETWQEIKQMSAGGIFGIPSKYDIVNDYFTYQPAELTVIGGRAKAGKSTFFLNEVAHKLEKGFPSAIFDTEMPFRTVLPRMLALKSGIPISEIRNGSYALEPAKVEAFSKAWKFWKESNFIFLYDPQWTYEKIYAASKILRTNNTFGLDFLVFDYIKDTGSKDFDNEKLNYALGSFTNFLKNDIAGALDIPVVAGAQMSRYDARLADSDSINRYASTVAYWMQKTEEMKSNEPLSKKAVERGNFYMKIDYNRLGESLQDSHLNFLYKGNTCSIEQAKWQPTKEESIPSYSPGDDTPDDE